MRTQ
jgi:hypothetical protein